MAAFELRDEDGTLKAKMDARVMSSVTQHSGTWRTYKRVNKPDTVCFEFSDDMVLNLAVVGVPITLYLWKGDKIVAVD